VGNGDSFRLQVISLCPYAWAFSQSRPKPATGNCCSTTQNADMYPNRCGTSPDPSFEAATTPPIPRPVVYITTSSDRDTRSIFSNPPPKPTRGRFGRQIKGINPTSRTGTEPAQLEDLELPIHQSDRPKPIQMTDR
jgi:hypothetical protein